jgi:hypothetical protein
MVYIWGTAKQCINCGSFTLANGKPAVTTVSFFGASMNLNLSDYPHNVPLAKDLVQDGKGFVIANGNPEIVTMLESDAIEKLQAKGIKVLLTFGGNWDDAGWAQFANEATAENFACQLAAIVKKYNLDGIDIDNENSYGKPHDNSLVMVTTFMRELMPNKIISKALWLDQYFKAKFKGKTLADNLTEGWDMYYGSSPSRVLPPHCGKRGMKKSTVSMGYNYPKQDPSDRTAGIHWVKKKGYGGVMIFNFASPENQKLAGKLVNVLYGPGNWNHNKN